mmetsp:Transcript_14416/g.17499  ORF Transcript_14416/g.17499 Transcript_14416/m.17499 type:complete len:551 (-) Transcript_14416:51-1703(-)
MGVVIEDLHNDHIEKENIAPRFKVNSRQGVISIEYEYSKEKQLGYKMFGELYSKPVSFLYSLDWCFFLVFGLSIVIPVVVNTVYNNTFANYWFFAFCLYAAVVASGYDVVRAKECILQFQSVVNLALGVSIVINSIVTAPTSLTLYYILSMSAEINVMLGSARPARQHWAGLASDVVLNVCNVTVFSLLFFGFIPVEEKIWSTRVNGHDITYSSIQIMLSNLVSIMLIDFKHFFSDLCAKSRWGRVFYTVIFVKEGEETRLDIERAQIYLEYEYSCRNSLGYAVLGEDHVLIQRAMAGWKVSSYYWVILSLPLLVLLIANCVWEIPELNALYVIAILCRVGVAMNLDPSLIKGCLYQFKSVLTILCAFLLAINSAVTGPVELTLLFTYFSLNQIQLNCHSALHPRVRRHVARELLFDLAAYFSVLCLIFFDYIKVRDIQSAFYAGPTEVHLSSLQTLLSNLSILVILSIQQNYRALCTSTGTTNIIFSVKFIEPGSLGRFGVNRSLSYKEASVRSSDNAYVSPLSDAEVNHAQNADAISFESLEDNLVLA